MNIYKYALPAVLAACSLQAFGWGQKGHDTVAYIAECHLTPATKHAVESLLDGKSIVYWANWLDNASHTPEYAYSKTWHYKNIDAGLDFDKAPKIKEGNIVDALYEQVAVLKNPQSTDEQKSLALKMVVHFLGDIHQPMHMGHASDRGGNSWHVQYFRRDNNLHSVWDSSLPESAHKWSHTEWQREIDRATPEEAHEIQAGNPTSWGKETYEICTQVYDKTPEGTNISYDYIAEWTPTVERQFLRGGLRLADVLNSIFDPQYKPANDFVK